MKYVKTLGLLTVAAAALMAFAAPASATILTSPEGTTYTGNIVATSTNSELVGSPVTVKCAHSRAEGSVSKHGVGNAGGTLSSLDFTECNYHTTVNKPGSLEIDSSNNVFSTGAEVTIITSVGTCVYKTNNTSIGSLTEGFSATHDIGSSKIPRITGNFLCGSSGTWTGSYDLTEPNDLWVD